MSKVAKSSILVNFEAWNFDFGKIQTELVYDRNRNFGRNFGQNRPKRFGRSFGEACRNTEAAKNGVFG